jgi:hypothetical protein
MKVTVAWQTGLKAKGRSATFSSWLNLSKSRPEINYVPVEGRLSVSSSIKLTSNPALELLQSNVSFGQLTLAAVRKIICILVAISVTYLCLSIHLSVCFPLYFEYWIEG